MNHRTIRQSADLDNLDNDDEELIEVMTQEQFDKQRAQEEAFLRKEGMKQCYEFTVREKVLELQIKDAGRVHYSTPPKPFDIKADLEVVEEDARDWPLAKLMSEEHVTRGTAIPENATEIKSLMYLGGKKEFKAFCTECMTASEKSIAEGLGSTPLFDIVAPCISLQELHIKGMSCIVSPIFVNELIKVAPHLQQTLKVLSVGGNQVEPQALDSLCWFKSLERLDLMGSFNTFCDTAAFYDSDSDVANRDKPYDNLLKLVNSLPNLNRLDLGYGHDASYLFTYMLSEEIVRKAQDKLKQRSNGRLTMDDGNLPEPWSSKEREKAARRQALLAIMKDQNEDDTIRAMAENEMKTLPVCKKRSGDEVYGGL